MNTLKLKRDCTEVSYILQPAASWIDEFFNWPHPNKHKCCCVCKNDPSTFCDSGESPRRCHICYEDYEPAWNITMNGLPEGDELMLYLRQWLVSLSRHRVALPHVAQPAQVLGGAHQLAGAARRVADDLSAATGVSVIPYSLHYVLFDRFVHIIPITEQILSLSLAAVLLVTALLLGSWCTGMIVTSVVALTAMNVMGVMGMWGIDLNAISLVNLVNWLGTAVEFCVYVTRAFMSAGSGLPVHHPASQKERDEWMSLALMDVGPSVRYHTVHCCLSLRCLFRPLSGVIWNYYHFHEADWNVCARAYSL